MLVTDRRRLPGCTSLAPAPTRRSRSGAFTLVELLVVIAIITLLVALLMPSLQEGLFLAKKANCMANQRNLYSSMLVYQNEYDTMPSAAREMSYCAFGSGTETVGFGLLTMNGFVVAQGLLACPHSNYLPGSEQQLPSPNPFPSGWFWGFFRQPNTFPMKNVQTWLYGQSEEKSIYKGYGYTSSYAYRRASTQTNESQYGGYGQGPDYISRVPKLAEEEAFPYTFLACAQQWGSQGFGRCTDNYTHDRRGSVVSCKDGHVGWFQMTEPRTDVTFMQHPDDAGCPKGYMPFCYPFDYPYIFPSSMFWGAADREM